MDTYIFYWMMISYLFNWHIVKFTVKWLHILRIYFSKKWFANIEKKNKFNSNNKASSKWPILGKIHIRILFVSYLIVFIIYIHYKLHAIRKFEQSMIMWITGTMGFVSSMNISISSCKLFASIYTPQIEI